MGAETYRLGKLNGRAVVTWWEGGQRRRFRFRKGINQEQLNAELKAFVKQREMLLTREVKTVGEIMDGYIADRKIDGKSVEKQEHSWKALAPRFAHMSPSDIGKKDCIEYVEGRIKAGRKIGTAWTELSVMRAAFGWAVKDKKIERAPHVFLPEQPPPKERYLLHTEARNLLAAARRTHHLWLFVKLALATAGRAGALLELQWDKVDFDRNTIDLRASEGNKIKRRAIVPMNDELRDALVEAKAGALTSHVVEFGGRPVGSIKRAFARAADRCGFTDVTPNTLRHTAGVWMAEADVSMSVIAQYMGHTSTKITEKHYARYSPSYLRRASAALVVGGVGLEPTTPSM